MQIATITWISPRKRLPAAKRPLLINTKAGVFSGISPNRNMFSIPAMSIVCGCESGTVLGWCYYEVV